MGCLEPQLAEAFYFYRTDRVRFTGPTFIGDTTIHAESEVIARAEQGGRGGLVSSDSE